MTFAEIHWLPITIHLLQALFVIVCGLMILLILMQRPKQEGLGAAFGGGVTDQVFGARTTNVLQRGTVYLGSMFFIIALALAVLVGQQNKTVHTANKSDTAAKVNKAAVPPAPEKPKSLTEELPPAPVIPPDSPAPSDVPPDASVPAPVIPAPTPAVPVPPSETAPTSPPVAPTESLPVTPPVAPPPADKAPKL